MAVENVPHLYSLCLLTAFKQIVLFVGYYLLLFIDPLVIICATSMAPCCGAICFGQLPPHTRLDVHS